MADDYNIEARFATFDGRKDVRDEIKLIAEAWSNEQTVKTNRLTLTVGILVKRRKLFLTADEFKGYIKYVSGKAPPSDSSTLWQYAHAAPAIAKLFADHAITEDAFRYACSVKHLEDIKVTIDGKIETVREIPWLHKGEPSTRAAFFQRIQRRVRFAADAMLAEHSTLLDRAFFVDAVQSHLGKDIDGASMAHSATVDAGKVADRAVKSALGFSNGKFETPSGVARDNFAAHAETLARKLNMTLVGVDELARLRQADDDARRWRLAVAVSTGSKPEMSDRDEDAIISTVESIMQRLAETA